MHSKTNSCRGPPLNLDWVITYVLHVTQPSIHGPLLVTGLSDFIRTEDLLWLRIFNLLTMLVAYGFFLGLLVSRGRTVLDLGIAALGGGLSYFILGFGVHENHSYILVIIATCIVILDKANARSLRLLVFTSLLHIVNLFLFYGFTGRPVVSRMLMGFDDTVIFAAASSISLPAVILHALRNVGFHGARGAAPTDVARGGQLPDCMS